MNLEGPIAVFDSGVGGLTVAAEIMRRLPGETLLYFGDTAHVPYGSRPVETIVRYATEAVEFLLRHDPKALVVACNTVSAVALDALRPPEHVPVVDVVSPGAKAAVEFSRSGRIGVVATNATVRSGSYTRRIRERMPDAQVFESAGPLLVPITEEGWPLDHAVVKGALERYVRPLLDEAVDVIVLGCTHYPLLKPAFRDAVGDDVFIVDSAEETAGALTDLLRERGCVRPVLEKPRHRFLVSDHPEGFRAQGSRFLMDRSMTVERVDLGLVSGEEED
ncbi:MAG: glutamate racemase [Planctomycetota bacterium]|jgi:glutamate racemase